MTARQTARPLRIATRASELALRQARAVQGALAERGIDGELVTYTTVGDRRLDVALTAIGGKGLFTRELEEDLRAARVDCCVHSLKDLPTAAPDGLEVVAQLEREDPRDALVAGPSLGSAAPLTLASLPSGARVGTSSLRRRAQLLAARPDLEVRELRGNVPTRLRKVDAAEVDAAILAAAGLHRLGLSARVVEYLGAPHWLPAAGQGAIAIQVRRDDAEVRALFAALDHPATTLATRAERAFLAALEGGCQVPIGALALRAASGEGMLYGLIGSVDGRRVVRGELPLDAGDPERSGRALADGLRARGGDELLAELRTLHDVPAPQPE